MLLLTAPNTKGKEVEERPERNQDIYRIEPRTLTNWKGKSLNFSGADQIDKDPKKSYHVPNHRTPMQICYRQGWACLFAIQSIEWHLLSETSWGKLKPLNSDADWRHAFASRAQGVSLVERGSAVKHNIAGKTWRKTWDFICCLSGASPYFGCQVFRCFEFSTCPQHWKWHCKSTIVPQNHSRIYAGHENENLLQVCSLYTPRKDFRGEWRYNAVLASRAFALLAISHTRTTRSRLPNQTKHIDNVHDTITWPASTLSPFHDTMHVSAPFPPPYHQACILRYLTASSPHPMNNDIFICTTQQLHRLIASKSKIHKDR